MAIAEQNIFQIQRQHHFLPEDFQRRLIERAEVFCQALLGDCLYVIRLNERMER